MHILAAILTALGAAAFWYYRMRAAGQALSKIGDDAGCVRGAYRRNRFRSKTESSPVMAVDDPAAAAVAFLISLASSGGSFSREAEEAIRDEMLSVMALPNVDKVFVFARRVADHVHDPGDLSLRFSRLWLGALQTSEHAAFHAMASRIAAIDGPPTDLQVGCLRALHLRLGLTRA